MNRYYHNSITRTVGKVATVLILWALAVFASAQRFSEPGVELNGCSVYTQNQGCTFVPERDVTVWVKHELRTSVILSIDRQALAPSRTPDQHRVQGGTRFTLTIPDGARLLSIRVGDRNVNFELNQKTRPDILVSARALNRKGELLEGIQQIKNSLATLERDWLGSAFRLLGQAQRRLGQVQQAKASLTTSIQSDKAVGRASSALRTATVLAYVLMEEGGYAAARDVLGQDFNILSSDSESNYNINYFKGLLAYNTSNAREAIKHLNLAAQQAQRSGQITQQVYAEVMLAVQLQRIGRSIEAERYLSRWTDEIPKNMSACDQSYVKLNIGWSRLLLLESGVDAQSPVAVLQEADTLAQQHCPSHYRANALTNLALARWHEQDFEGAERLVKEAMSLDGIQFRTMLWLIDIEGRVAVAKGLTKKALETFSRLEQLATATLSISAHWRAVVGKARAYAAAHEVTNALEAYREAELLLVKFLPLIPFDQGHEAVLNARALATQEHVGLLLEVSRNEEAFALARESRVRSLQAVRIAERVEQLSPQAKLLWERALSNYQALRAEVDADAKSAWMLPLDELAELEQKNESRKRQLVNIVDQAALSLNELSTFQLAAPRTNELMVLMYEVHDGWAVFAHDGRGLTVSRPKCAGLQRDPLAVCLLTPLHSDLDAATALRLLPTGRVSNIDFHAVVVGGAPLIQKLPVYYSLDLADHRSSNIVQGTALLVADAGGDLEAARRELKAVSLALERAKRWRQHILKQQSADASSVREALQHSQIFHFAGHARFAGEYGWDSQIELAGDTYLGVTDIITMESAPSLVVLSGCETARTHSGSFAQSMGLASAFLVAGSNSVIATSRPVLDTTAEKLTSEFYRQWTAGLDPHVSLRNAQIKLMQSRPHADWAAYRVFTR